MRRIKPTFAMTLWLVNASSVDQTLRAGHSTMIVRRGLRMRMKYFLLATVLASASAIASPETDLKHCVAEANRNSNVNAARDCFITFTNRFSANTPIANGIVLRNVDHDDGYIIYNFQLTNVDYNTGSEQSLQLLEEIRNWLDSEDATKSQRKGYCKTLGKARDVFEDGAIMRFYDKKGLFITLKVIEASECESH